MIPFLIISLNKWLLILCISAGLGYALALYYKETRNEFSFARRLIMGLIRGITVSFIAFFLLNPFFRSTTKTTQEPLIIIAQDQSLSIIASADSSYYRNEYPVQMQGMIDDIERRYSVYGFAFGQHFREGIDFEYSDKQTNIAEVFYEVQSRFLNRNVGALILASDGIFNKGIHPQYTTQFLPFPVYTIALGDTTPVRDAAIVNVLHNRIAYFNNTFPLEVHVRGLLCDGLNTTVRILKDGRVVFSEPITFSGNNDNRFIPVELLADKPGLQRYRVEVLPVEGENALGNNVKDIFIEVLEARQKVLLLFSAPHPDVGAIRQTLLNQENYEVEVFEASQFSGNLQDFNLVILHQIPSLRQAHTDLLRRVNESGLPMLHILGSSSDLNVFNTLGYGLTITGSGRRTDETLPAFNPAFTLFTLSDEFFDALRFFPPLFSPFGTYRESLSSNPLFYRQIGSLVTEAPLMTFLDLSGKKIGFITGEGIWRWRLANFSRRGNHNAFDELITKSIQYLALRERKEQFMVHTRNTWEENEIIEFTAEFYNKSFEPVNIPEVELLISDEEGNQYPFTFSRTRNAYALRAGSLAPGNFTYKAATQWQNETFEVIGAFSVIPLQVELTNTVADHRLMYALAEKYGGAMFYPNQLDELVKILHNRDDMKPVYFLEKSYLELIDIKWLLFLIIGLLSFEWLMRRISGGY